MVPFLRTLIRLRLPFPLVFPPLSAGYPAFSSPGVQGSQAPEYSLLSHPPQSLPSNELYTQMASAASSIWENTRHLLHPVKSFLFPPPLFFFFKDSGREREDKLYLRVCVSGIIVGFQIFLCVFGCIGFYLHRTGSSIFVAACGVFSSVQFSCLVVPTL